VKLGLGLYRHMLTREYYDFARQAGCTHVVVHLVDYFKENAATPFNNNLRNNQPTGSKYELWGVAGERGKLWTVDEMVAIRREIEEAGLVRAGVGTMGAWWRGNRGHGRAGRRCPDPKRLGLEHGV